MRYPLPVSEYFRIFYRSVARPSLCILSFCPQLCYRIPDRFSPRLSAVYRHRRVSSIDYFLKKFSIIRTPTYCVVSGTADEFRVYRIAVLIQPFPFRIVFVIAPIQISAVCVNLSEFIHSLISNANNRYTAE